MEQVKFTIKSAYMGLQRIQVSDAVSKGDSTCNSHFFLTETMTVSILDSLHMVDTGDSYDNDDNVKYIVSHTKDLFIFFLVI